MPIPATTKKNQHNVGADIGWPDDKKYMSSTCLYPVDPDSNAFCHCAFTVVLGELRSEVSMLTNSASFTNNSLGLV